MFEFSSVFLPEIMMAVAAMVLLIAGVVRDGMNVKFIFRAAVLVLAVVAWSVSTLPADKFYGLHGMFVSDRFAIYMKVVALVAAALVLIISLEYSREGKQEKLRFEYPVLVLLAVTGMMVMISANDLISLYMGLELQSLALYVLTSIERDAEKSSEAGLKYFMLGALSSGILLYGASLVYGFSGTTNFTKLAALYPEGAEVSRAVVLGMVFVFIGLCFKLSAAPFHMWAPDVYEGAPKPVTAFFASAPKVAAIALFIRVAMEPFGALVVEWRQVILFAAVASMAVGALGALRQNNIKRLMAYSSISHMGFVLVGLAAASAEGVQAMLVYSAIYVVMSIGVFTCILLMKRGQTHVEHIDDLAGLGRKHPGYAAAMAILMLSMAGIPPLAGFFGKLFIFQAAVKAGLIYLAVIGVMLSVIGAYYYLRIIKVMYFDEPQAMANGVFDQDISTTMKVMVIGTGAFNIVFSFFPAPLLSAAKLAAESLVAL